MTTDVRARPLVRNKALRRFLRNPGTVVGTILALLLVLVAIFAPQLSGDPLAQDLTARLQPPSGEHLLGTDQLGRDVWARVVHGSRISLRIGLTVVTVALVLGGFIGLVAGMFGGLVDEIAMRITDIFFAFPALILAMAIAGALGPSLGNLMIAVAAVTWPYYARLIRAQVLTLKTLDFVDASRALGAGRWRQALRHVLPNALTPLLVQASFDVGGAILTAAGLGFIGFGAQPPTPEWGAVVSETRSFISEAPWASSAPAIAILITVLAFNLLGDGLRDVLDPRGRRRN